MNDVLLFQEFFLFVMNAMNIILICFFSTEEEVGRCSTTSYFRCWVGWPAAGGPV